MSKKGLQTLIFDFIEGKKYFGVRSLKKHLAERKLSYSATTVNQYLYNLRTQGKVFDAGRGWYSTLSNGFLLDTSPVSAISSTVEANYPLLKFSCWSTEQVQAFSHHLQTRFTQFLYAERDALTSLTEFLVAGGHNAYCNPGKRDSDRYYRQTGPLVILRSSITEEPVNGNYATIEKLLVDLYLEKDRVHLMEESEYNRVFSNLASSQRINIARLLRYAHRRKVKYALTQNILAKDMHLIAQ